MKSPLLAIALASLSVLPTLAADLPYRKGPPQVYVPPVPLFTWTGFYVGVNAGAAFSNGRDGYAPLGFPGAGPVGPGGSGDHVGFTGGGQIGYNWQVSQFVLGLETDFNYIDRDRKNDGFTAPAAGPYFTVNHGNDGDFFGTVRGRVGYAVLDNRLLIYGTGGLAYGASSGRDTITYNPGTGAATSAYTGGHRNDLGYSVGGGLEYAFTPNWSAKVEYLYNDFGRRNDTLVSATGPAGTSFTGRRDNSFSVVRAGLNYKFW